MHRKYLSTIKSLRSKSNIVITKPDKESDAVLLYKTATSKKWTPFLMTKPNFWHSDHQAKKTTPWRSNPGYNVACCSCTKTIYSPQIYTISFDRLAPSGRACMALPKHARKMSHINPMYLWSVHRNASWPNILLFFSNRFSPSIRATAYGTLLPLLIILKLEIRTLKTSNPKFGPFWHFEFIY